MAGRLRVFSVGAPELEWLAPPLPPSKRAFLPLIRQWALTTPGLAAAWLAPAWLDEREMRGLFILALADEGWECAEGLKTTSGAQAEVSALSRAALEDALAVDVELASVLALGYRIFGDPLEVRELEEMARVITEGV